VLRPIKEGGFAFDLLEPSDGDDTWVVLEFDDGVLGRTRVLHDWQAAQRPSTPSHQVPRFISNTWGDRSRDSRIQQTFLEDEIDAAHSLGVDVFQIDDGWQKGITANSALAEERGGVWEGFWNADPEFWQPHPERHPNGLEPIVERAQRKGMHLGLWFAPDSWNDFENWQRDAEAILGFHQTYGIEHIKIDGVKARTETSLVNLRRFFHSVLDGSEGRVIFDLDVTAEVRPGYFGAIEVGPLFVENRYTDFHSYWPHQTLRNLWSLGRWVDPRRLRMEFLNNVRNTELYAGDPLAPSEYDPATLFATVMFGNPLGWFEVSNLPDSYAVSVPDLVRVWKAHREELFGGTILSVGDAPDGYAYTGFVSVSDTQGYALVFRERNQNAEHVIDVPGVDFEGCDWEVLATHGGGEIRSEDGGIGVSIGEELGFVFGKFARQ
jgi:alpha-galactosidase